MASIPGPKLPVARMPLYNFARMSRVTGGANVNGPKWMTKENLDPAVLVRWQSEIEQTGFDAECTALTDRAGKEELRHTLRSSQTLVRAFELAIREGHLPLEWSHLLLLTDRSGIVLSTAGSPDKLGHARRIGIERGTRLDLPHAGVNAIAMAVRLERPSHVRGDEHDLRLFREWSSLCTPVAADGRTFGFLGVCCPCPGESSDVELIWIEFYLQVLKERIARHCPMRRRMALDRRFGEYGLSPREREVAHYWAQNMGGLQIASRMGLAESTVRSMIKNIYRKIGVSDKGQFMRHFLA
jgi:DNA-binding CsgD family transcriptional regulator